MSIPTDADKPDRFDLMARELSTWEDVTSEGPLLGERWSDERNSTEPFMLNLAAALRKVDLEARIWELETLPTQPYQHVLERLDNLRRQLAEIA